VTASARVADRQAARKGTRLERIERGSCIHSSQVSRCIAGKVERKRFAVKYDLFSGRNASNFRPVVPFLDERSDLDHVLAGTS